MDFAFPPQPVASLLTDDDRRYPVRRIFCVGRNYADHAREMGHQPERGAPFYFTKSPHHLTQEAVVPYPAETKDYHHEIELAVMLGDGASIWGLAVALDMTRRDLQAVAKEKRRPWDLGKDVESSAIFGTVAQGVTPENQHITLDVNGEPRQGGRLGDMIHTVPEIIDDLSRYYDLGPGDVILTGTPAGVGPVQKGDHLVGRVDGLPTLNVTFT